MKRSRFLSFPVFVFAVLAPGARLALAQPSCSAAYPSGNYVCINPNPENFAALEQSLGRAPGTLAPEILSRVDGLFQTTNAGPFLKDFQNAQSFSTKGLGVDYASEATLVEAGATLSIASNVDKAYKPSGSYTDPPIAGGGANFSLMGGLGLGLFGLDPVMIFGNWFKGSSSLGQLDGTYHNWGLHAQVRLFGPSRKSSAAKFLIRWGGIAITSGADYSRMSLSLGKPISSTLNLPASMPGYPGAAVALTSDISGTLRFTVAQTTWSVPLEITTSLRLLSLITIYGGIGFDWQLGGGSDMNVEMANASLTNKATNVPLGTVTIHANAHEKPSPARMREIIGLQFGLFDMVRFFLQMNVSGSSPMLTSLAGGLRLAY